MQVSQMGKTESSIRQWGMLLLSFGVILGAKSQSQAAAELKFGDIVKAVTIKGDLRIRHESFFRTDKNGKATANGSSDRYRHRQRLRLRLQTDFSLPNNLTAKIRFASGTGEQVSTNQSFDNLSNQKEFWIDRAYIEWKPQETMTFMVGKIGNPFWTPYSADLVWDGDFNPEGAGESIQFFGPFKTKLFVNALQMVVDEDSSGTQDQGLVSQQIGFETLLFDQSKFTFAIALHEWLNEDKNTLAGTVQDGNRRNGSGVLLNEFRVLEYTGEFKTELLSVPVSLQGTAITNQKDKLNPNEDKGFQYGGIIGKASSKNSAEVAYFYKRLETDATIADVADSDFGNGGTNRNGHIMWIAYSPTDFTTLSLKHFVTDTLEVSLSPNNKPIRRTQVDFIVKF